jgi:glucokinase
MAGNVDVEHGIVLYRKVEAEEPDAREWQYETHRIVHDLTEALHLPVAIENDGSASLIAEWRRGAASGADNIVLLSLGTYVASGVVLKSQLLHRRTSSPLLGPILSRSGNSFDYQGLFCCGKGLERAAKAAYGRQVSGTELSKLARSGDEQALRIFHEAGEWLGSLLTSSINIFDPEVVVINGSVAESLDLMLPSATPIVEQWTIPGPFEPARIKQGKFLKDSGLVGAAIIAQEKLNRSMPVA